MKALLLGLLAACGPEPAAAHRQWDVEAAARLLDVGRYDEAAERFRGLLAEGVPRADVGLGLALRGQGDLLGAVACLAGAGEPEELGHVFTALRRDDEAAACYSAALTEDPLTLCNLAAAFSNAGRPGALELYELAASRMCLEDPALCLPLEAIAEELEARGDMAHARRTLEQAEYLYERRE